MAEVMQTREEEKVQMDEGENKVLTCSGKSRLVFAFYVTTHGFGHATRVAEVVQHLVQSGHEVHIVTGVPEHVFERGISDLTNVHIRKQVMDCGVVQADALTVDPIASLELYWKTAMVRRSIILETESAWLRLVGASLVVSDVVPIACAAASKAGIPAVCVSNFSWDFIYSGCLVGSNIQHQGIVWQIVEDYSKALFLLRLPGYCPTPSFQDLIDVPLVVRPKKKSRSEVRQKLGVSEETKLLMLSFGGQDFSWSVKAEFLPPGWKCFVGGKGCLAELPSNFVQLEQNIYTPDIIGASDCVLGKIGYGTVSECLACRVPLIFVQRNNFNEEPFLQKLLEDFNCGLKMHNGDFCCGKWGPYLEQAYGMRPDYCESLKGGEVVASILEDAATGNIVGRKKRTAVERLRDAIAFGYYMPRMPEGTDSNGTSWWYLEQQPSFESYWSPLSASNTLLNASSDDVLHNAHAQSPEIKMLGTTAGFQILRGSTHNLDDTDAFLRLLSRMDVDANFCACGATSEQEAQEWQAACQLFRWEDDVFVTRAPGRLDVMGGIADYSGSMVLQLPIKEACHVAVQRHSLAKQPQLWKHAEKEHKLMGLRPFLQIVSFGSQKSNRSATFCMDLTDFLDDNDEPIEYAAAQKYFDQDPAHKWAGYVAGAFLVLLREMGIRFHGGVSILVSSDVPEGKGVSSSAAIEVATMTAVAAAHGILIPPRTLALLCQKVENLVVGAPCGVMDQMASACGECGKLLAMICQPAEVLDHVEIPGHIRFWGIDSGVRHSVGGADYGTVRAAAFMGRQIIANAARQIALSLEKEGEVPKAHRDCLHSFGDDHHTNPVLPAHALPDDGILSSLKLRTASAAAASSTAADKDLTYLCRVPPHRFNAVYAAILPVEIDGQTFISKYGSHGDPVTVIDPDTKHPVRAATAHPVYENFRVQSFAELLTAKRSERQLSALGELMFQSHCSYSLCGLGSQGTDQIVAMVEAMTMRANSSRDKRPSLFGAKITGGGSGGTVCVLGTESSQADKEIREVQQHYRNITGHLPYIFEGSSPGAAQFGYLQIKRQSCISC
ncbi:hypothetical protein CBR_g29486 [Chara braunii]|uniref:L-arabinokinase n=1 Tax=Chara braunii TaxID=69332 RepID=A0A388LAM4_CHABU|nr:hypothetical protein CBR_g29486 [Chara braunii]|eukprot:GBG79336.1 hypothetical protein CBR_g29486 [Chara braunii]